MTDPLHSHLVRFARRLRLRDGWRLAQRTFWIAGVAALLAQTAGHFWPLVRLGLWTFLPFLVWLLAVICIALFRPLPMMRVALRVDSELDLRERLSTALALQNLQSAFPPALVRSQRQDALFAAQNVKSRRDFPLEFFKRPLAAAGAVLAAIVLLAVLPNPMDAVLAQRLAVAQAAKEQAAQVEKAQQAIEAAKELTPEQRQELLRKLAELASLLRNNPGSLEQALADLSTLDQALREKLDPNNGLRAANLESLSAQLQALSGIKKDPSQDQAQAATAALAQLASQAQSADAKQRQLSAESLAQMAAQASQSGDAQLAQALSSLAQAIQSGDQQAASAAARAAQQAISQSQAQLSSQAALQKAIDQLQASRQALSQAGQSVAQNQGQAPAAGQSLAQGQGQGQGQSQGQGQVGGGGSKANTLPPATRRGKARNPQGNAPLTPASDLPAQVYAPWQRSQSSGGQLFIPGKDTGQGQTQTTEGNSALPGSTNPSLVPYNQVYYLYFNAANQAMQQSYIPPGMLDYIRQYFSQLQP